MWRWYRSRRARTRWGLGLAALLAGLTALGALSAAPKKESGSRPATTPAASAPGTTATAASRPPPTTGATSTARRDRTDTTSIAAAAAPRGARRSAQAALDALPVKGRAPKTGYSREQFGDGWATVAGCDMRDRILRRDLRGKVFATGDRCEIVRGRLDDPYTATAVPFVRGGAPTSTSTTWSRSATPGRRARSSGPRARAAVRERPAEPARDRRGHEPREGRRRRRDLAAARTERFRCDYVARQVAVKRQYAASGHRAEHDAIARARPLSGPDAPARRPRAPAAGTVAARRRRRRRRPASRSPSPSGSGARLRATAPPSAPPARRRCAAAPRTTPRTPASTATRTASPASADPASGSRRQRHDVPLGILDERQPLAPGHVGRLAQRPAARVADHGERGVDVRDVDEQLVRADPARARRRRASAARPRSSRRAPAASRRRAMKPAAPVSSGIRKRSSKPRAT